jgi:hypothetical protein
MAKKPKCLDLDLSMGDLNGDTTLCPKSPKSSSQVVEFVDPDAGLDLSVDEKDGRECLRRMESYCGKMWISIPHLSGEKFFLETQKLDESSPEFFFNWICYLLPSMETANHLATDYENLEVKERAFKNVCAMFKSLQFPKNKQL